MRTVGATAGNGREGVVGGRLRGKLLILRLTARGFWRGRRGGSRSASSSFREERESRHPLALLTCPTSSWSRAPPPTTLAHAAVGERARGSAALPRRSVGQTGPPDAQRRCWRLALVRLTPGGRPRPAGCGVLVVRAGTARATAQERPRHAECLTSQRLSTKLDALA